DVSPVLSVRDPKLIGADAYRALMQASKSRSQRCRRRNQREVETSAQATPASANASTAGYLGNISHAANPKNISPVHRTRHPRRRAQQPCAREHDPEFRHSASSRSRAARSVSHSPEISREKTAGDYPSCRAAPAAPLDLRVGPLTVYCVLSCNLRAEPSESRPLPELPS